MFSLSFHKGSGGTNRHKLCAIQTWALIHYQLVSYNDLRKHFDRLWITDVRVRIPPSISLKCRPHMSLSSIVSALLFNFKNNRGVWLTPSALLLHPCKAGVSWDWLEVELLWRASNQLITRSFLPPESIQSEVMSNPCPACKHLQLHQSTEVH